jgi:hypothetical protein
MIIREGFLNLSKFDIYSIQIWKKIFSFNSVKKIINNIKNN